MEFHWNIEEEESWHKPESYKGKLKKSSEKIGKEKSFTLQGNLSVIPYKVYFEYIDIFFCRIFAQVFSVGHFRVVTVSNS